MDSARETSSDDSTGQDQWESGNSVLPEIQPAPPRTACRVLSIANQKGGVGKTTTAINLSASLAMAGRRILVLDMDPQSNATSALGQKVDHTTRTIYDVLLGEATLREAILTTDALGIRIVPSSPQFAGAEVELVSVENREFLLKEQLDGLKSEYDYVIIDCPPSLGLLTVNALSASDGVIVPIQCEYLALEGLSHLLETLQAVRKSLNPKLRVEGLLLTMYDGRLSLSQQVANDARTYFGSRVYRTMIPRNVRLGEAPSFGKPVILYDRACAGSMSYVNLAKEIMENESQGVGAWSESAHTGLPG
ncbi:MAG: AAA family ATPase [Candidatus Eisenbacteria bacterium]|uniref:AAA family ATPase n=1 Tax=Eiseniibacteriota bacterium TaxID=2212470 RepID=A0A948S0H4_UNCEI|nr:AAA family ATPase [Candidatus Eisenbacteria bacterium]MBU1947249.1 AAA family ATPase [Candidatus Eisenbacteria bacterium]MBU2693331.1 AAA family ATPase [Candidatus Eisenbacteria bacterium]